MYGETGTALGLPKRWLLVVLAATAAQLVAAWTVQRIVLRAESWLDVAGPQLVGNAVSHVVPAGNAAAAGVQLRMLGDAGYPMATAATALGAGSVLSTAAGFIVLPMLVLLGTAVGGDVEPHLVRAMWLGAAALAAVLAVIVYVLTHERTLRGIAAVVSRLARRAKREVDAGELGERLLEERAIMRATLRRRGALILAAAVARPLFDYLALLCSLRAVGVDLNPAAVLAAFIVANIAGMVPLTPGGLGFVEAGLAGALTLAGARDVDASVAVATYRLIETWLPCFAAIAAYWLFRRRHRVRLAAPVQL